MRHDGTMVGGVHTIGGCMFDGTNGVSQDYLDVSLSLWDFMQVSFETWWASHGYGELSILYRFEAPQGIRLHKNNEGYQLHVKRPAASTKDRPIEVAHDDLMGALDLLQRRLNVTQPPALPSRDMVHTFLEALHSWRTRRRSAQLSLVAAFAERLPSGIVNEMRRDILGAFPDIDIANEIATLAARNSITMTANEKKALSREMEERPPMLTGPQE